MVHLSGESLACDLLWEVQDQVAHLDRKVSLLLAAAGIPEPVRAGGEDEGILPIVGDVMAGAQKGKG